MGDDLLADALARPRVRANQLGYLPDGPQRVTVVTAASDPLPWRVRPAVGGPALRGGLTTPWPTDPSSGLRVQVADLAAGEPGGALPRDVPLTVEVDDRTGLLTSHPFRISADLYRPLLHDALRFFYAQRSGTPIDDAVLPGYARPAGHTGVAPNLGDTAVRGWTGPDAERLYPGWRLERSLDVSGGWYDAGDHGKYVVSGALPASMLLDAEALGAGAEGGPGPTLLDEALWQVDWIARMQVPAGEQHAGLAFHRVHDAYWTPLPLMPDRDPAPRVLHRPSTAAALHLAAVAAQAAARLAGADPVRSRALLVAAERAWAAAEREPALLAPADDGAHGGGPYDDADLSDDRYWAAAELYLATGDGRYRSALEGSPWHRGDLAGLDGFGWNALAPWARLRLARHGTRLPDGERERLREDVLASADRLVALAGAQPWDQPYAPVAGWDWGSTGQVLSNVMILASAFELAGHRHHRDAAVAGLDLLLGRNAVGLSFVTGYGAQPVHRQRVRHFGHALDPSFPPPPPGCLAGGPASLDYPGFPGDPRFAGLAPQLCYVDEPTSETTNDVCIRWNAPLLWTAAFLTRTARP